MADVSSDSCLIYYDKSWQPCGRANAQFTLSLTLSRENDLSLAVIQVLEDQTPLYRLDVKKFVSMEDAN